VNRRASCFTASAFSRELRCVVCSVSGTIGAGAGRFAAAFFGAAFIVLHGMEWTNLIHEGMTPFKNPWAATVPQFGGTFFTLTGMHMLHVTIGVIYLGVVALRKKFLPILLGIWLIAWLTIPASSVFHYGVHVLLVGCITAAAIVFLKPKDYDSHDVEVAGLYWHFVDLVWMFIFPLVYLMSTKV
jgi:cytochrome c oxidase subunit 3